MTVRRTWVIVVVALLLIAVVGVVAWRWHSAKNAFALQYYYTSETVFQRISVDRARLSHTYFPDASGRCAQWVAQMPCWTKEELRTREAALSRAEVEVLIGLLRELGWMRLDSVYAPSGQRNYPHVLSVQLGKERRDIIYQSYPDAPPMPEPFARILDHLSGLMAAKFGEP